MFKVGPTFGGAAISRFPCGKRRPRSLMMTRKQLGCAQGLCSPSWQAIDAGTADD